MRILRHRIRHTRSAVLLPPVLATAFQKQEEMTISSPGQAWPGSCHHSSIGRARAWYARDPGSVPGGGSMGAEVGMVPTLVLKTSCPERAGFESSRLPLVLGDPHEKETNRGRASSKRTQIL